MRVNQIKKCLRSYPCMENTPKMQETIAECRRITRNSVIATGKRSTFLEFLSEVFRMNGMKIFGGQIVTLIIVCVISGVVDDFPRMIPVFIPFFVMAALPVLYRAEINRMNEIELATRNSCAQLLLARLIIIGTSDIVCFTFLLIVESVCLGLALGIVNLILYVFVPYVLCVASVLRLMRSGKRSFSSSIAMSVMTSLLWGILALVMPGLYQASAVGIWMICFIAFTIFFVIELEHLILYVKEGRVYGFIS
ncbi:MAG: hypothetical protein K6E53_01260 [Lachnospiraceae bacterium]|nr:hypothetical protein [Lachnospiraceae bacterium]